MRITNSMMSSKMLLNINNNLKRLDSYYTKLATSKEIQVPSDNPILAARALKFRANVAMTEQYQRNVKQGLSWMEVTEGAFRNVNNIIEKLKELLVQGSNDSNTPEQRQMISTQIREIISQIGSEMNVNYTGRYVFSGYRTDQPTVFQADSPNDNFNINQYFTAKDIERTFSLQKSSSNSQFVSYEVDIIKLPYASAENLTFSIVNAAGASVSTFAVTKKSVTDADAYQPTANQVYFIPETGELVLGSGVSTQVSNLPNNQQVKVNYDKKGFLKDEPNPRVYFECIQDAGTANAKSYNMNSQSLQYEFGIGIRIPVNTLGKDVFSDKMFADLVSFVSFIDSVKLSDSGQLRAFYRAQNPNISDADLEKLVNDHISNENLIVQKALQHRFDNMIGIMDNHANSISKEHSNLGSRMSRLNLIDDRLMDDNITYTNLMSQNEDADIESVAMKISEASAVYQAALMAGSQIIQLTLANFI